MLKLLIASLYAWPASVYCQSTMQCYDQVIGEAVKQVTFRRDFALVCGTNVDHWISNYGDKSEMPMWMSVGFISGRYELTLSAPVAIDYSQCKFQGTTDAEVIHLAEITSVNITTSGRAQASFGQQWRLNRNQWRNLIKNSGDWSIVGIGLTTNSPVKGVEKYVEQFRASLSRLTAISKKSAE